MCSLGRRRFKMIQYYSRASCRVLCVFCDPRWQGGHQIHGPLGQLGGKRPRSFDCFLHDHTLRSREWGQKNRCVSPCRKA